MIRSILALSIVCAATSVAAQDIPPSVTCTHTDNMSICSDGSSAVTMGPTTTFYPPVIQDGRFVAETPAKRAHQCYPFETDRLNCF